MIFSEDYYASFERRQIYDSILMIWKYNERRRHVCNEVFDQNQEQDKFHK